MEQRAGEYKVPKRRAKKHPLAPKRPMSAFLKYSKDKRKEVKEANPDLNNTDISRLLGQMWNEASEQEKQPYITEELTARAAYKCAIAKFRVSQRNQEMELIRNAAETRKVQVTSAPQSWNGITPSRSHHNVRRVTPSNCSEGHGSFTSPDISYHRSMPPLPNIDRNHGPDILERDTGALSHHESQTETRQVYNHNNDYEFRYNYPPPASQYPYPERQEQYYHHGYHKKNDHGHSYYSSPHHAYGNQYGYYHSDYYSQPQPHHNEHRSFDEVTDHLSLSPKHSDNLKSDVADNSYEHAYPRYSNDRRNDYYYYSYAPVYDQNHNIQHSDQKGKFV